MKSFWWANLTKGFLTFGTVFAGESLGCCMQSLFKKKGKMAGSMAQILQHLSYKCQDLFSNPSTAQKYCHALSQQSERI
jgi:hypothetical protein